MINNCNELKQPWTVAKRITKKKVLMKICANLGAFHGQNFVLDLEINSREVTKNQM